MVCEWPTPKTTTEVRAFVGLCSYYRRFVRNFSVLASPLNALTQKGALFDWTPDCDDAFQSLKHALTNPPIVAHPKFSLPFLLYTDASHTCIGSVLAQVQNGKEHVIAYSSHTLTFFRGPHLKSSLTISPYLVLRKPRLIMTHLVGEGVGLLN